MSTVNSNDAWHSFKGKYPALENDSNFKNDVSSLVAAFQAAFTKSLQIMNELKPGDAPDKLKAQLELSSKTAATLDAKLRKCQARLKEMKTPQHDQMLRDFAT